MSWTAVFIGGGIGACLRIAVATRIDAQMAGATAPFPWGLLLVNALGCFAIGGIATFADELGWLSPTARLFAIGGVLGGFTTFSSFGLDTFRLIGSGHLGLAALNAGASVLLAVLGVATGVSLARALA